MPLEVLRVNVVTRLGALQVSPLCTARWSVSVGRLSPHVCEIWNPEASFPLPSPQLQLQVGCVWVLARRFLRSASAPRAAGLGQHRCGV